MSEHELEIPQEIKQENTPKKKLVYRIGRNTKLLCPLCRTVTLGIQETANETVTLECKHKRELSLPPKKNSIGIEQIIYQHLLAVELFPHTDSSVNTHAHLVAAQIRETW